MNQVWLYLVLIAHDLTSWTQTLLLDGALAKAAPKRLRYTLLHTAGRLAFHDDALSSNCNAPGPGPVSSPQPSQSYKRSQPPPTEPAGRATTTTNAPAPTRSMPANNQREPSPR
jgi:hypothetical protein